jgi:hypothetical protein
MYQFTRKEQAMGRIEWLGRHFRAARHRRAQKALDSIQVAKPCSARWEDMAGDEKVRFCAHCKLNVFNLSAMDLDEAARVIAEKDGRLCVRFYRRRDGKTLTKDCPVGVKAWRRRVIAAYSAACGAVAALATGFAASNPLAQHEILGSPPPVVRDDAVMGDMAAPQPIKEPIEMGKPMMGTPPAPLMGEMP